LIDRVRRRSAEFGEPAVPRQPCGVAHEAAEAPVIRVLVFNEAGCQ
jgi:hypothetical protein